MTTGDNIMGDVPDFVRVEPSAAHRAAARTLFAMYTALLEAGFTEGQALTLTGDMLTAVISDDDDDD